MFLENLRMAAASIGSKSKSYFICKSSMQSFALCFEAETGSKGTSKVSFPLLCLILKCMGFWKWYFESWFSALQGHIDVF